MINQGIKVLIVDDAVLVVTRVSAIIEEVVCVSEVITAANFEEAIFRINNDQPDIILLDIHLKEKSGIELLEYVKTYHPQMKAIMFTNQTSDNYKSLCEKIGSDHFIDKSSEFESIGGIIESYCVQ